MSDTQQPVENQTDTSAEKAYAAAAEAVAVKPEPAVAAKPEVSVPTVAAASLEAAPVAEPAKVETRAVKPAPAPKAAAAPKPKALKAKAAPVAKFSKVAAETVAAAPKLRNQPVKAALVVKRMTAKPTAPKVAAKLPAKNITPPARPVAVAPAKLPKMTTASQLKDKTMDMSSKFTDGFKTVVSDAQGKAKEVYSKGSVLFGQYGEFTKGNVQAAVASGKILASGLKGMGDTLVADTKETIETISSDVKQIATIKTPADLVKLQGDLMQRNLDKAVAYNSKATEAMIKLTNEMMAPVSARLSLAMEKIRKAA